MSAPPFEPRNELESLLVRASQDAAARPAFYRAFLDSVLWVAGEHGPGGEARVLAAQHGGRSCAFAFTSEERVAALGRPVPALLRAQGRAVLEILPSDASLLLNVGSAYGKEFVPLEIRALLDGSLLAVPRPSAVPPGARVLLGAPPVPMPTLVERLRHRLETLPGVAAAWLGWLELPDQSVRAHAVVGLRMAPGAEARFASAVAALALVAREVVAPGEPLDFVDVGSGEIGRGVERECPRIWEAAR
ncbi:MAG: enhanced serine sensitivity protein SseB C-terminal domain-containing protein [Planctomycetales bacterium]|nr:enhanced serine sensitivity protein SseB C-terminal domain-containing protein [Planctomycetales bacterium]